MNSALNELTMLYFKRKREQYPNFPIEYIAQPKYKDTSANGLTRCIVEFLNMSNHQAERISNAGRYIDQKKTYIDTLGIKRTIGTGKYIPGTGTNGTADISATINGKSVKVEVKIGRDKQSEDQENYQSAIEAAGGLYFVARDFESFHVWYNHNFKTTINGTEKN
ncbi:MAG: hypothetical protein K0S44_1884 [Bacteroidetes bacterium]|jgi:hypothetical protein|nr:hypothetical protein [Bacteroidota bacterium]